jgi:tetratricopeptide (TPR) repeat protein
VSLERENYDEAVGHFEQADEDDIYVNYYHARALEGAGQSAEAKRLYEKVADWNFNSAELALVRKDAAAKARS